MVMRWHAQRVQGWRALPVVVVVVVGVLVLVELALLLLLLLLVGPAVVGVVWLVLVLPQPLGPVVVV